MSFIFWMSPWCFLNLSTSFAARPSTSGFLPQFQSELSVANSYECNIHQLKWSFLASTRVDHKDLRINLHWFQWLFYRELNNGVCLKMKKITKAKRRKKGWRWKGRKVMEVWCVEWRGMVRVDGWNAIQMKNQLRK